MVEPGMLRVPAAHGGELMLRRAGTVGATPIVFLHGYALSSVVWERQLRSATLGAFDLVALDLRGHGGSSVGSADLGASATWAGDVRTVIEALGLERPVVVAWSYAGLVLGDFLAAGGASAIRGIALVAAAPLLDRPEGETDDPFFSLIPALTDPDAAVRAPAERRFVDLLSAAPLDAPTTTRLTDAVALVSPVVRDALMRRKLDHLADYGALALPALVLHGERDALLPPVVSDIVASRLGDVEQVRFPDLGHAPFLEDPAAFDAVLERFVRRVH